MGGEDWFGGLKKKSAFFYFVCACVQYPGKPEEGGGAPRVGVMGVGWWWWYSLVFLQNTNVGFPASLLCL